ncbi:hypothetical protein BZG02_07775 [Labilibaculum filiforme]|uniref:Thiol:disulfide interchange protein DsbD N-terminal domain-containing protein n=1 Tax=Labilibaculum filiforme TaxID=1940526 RepID=A0A2N3I0Q5_9BACT|nr:hypothetical protein BZG02_07775 [Labilibaculum filiforme]
MTAEAKQVFANAIVYTHKHAKDKRIAKKYNDRIYTKDFIYWTLHNIKMSSFKKSQELKIEQNNDIIKRQDGVKEKQKRGEELSDIDQMLLAFKPMPLESFEQFLAKYMEKKPYLKETGLDTVAIRKYLLENMDYFYAEPDAFEGLKIDEDCKSLGIANTDIKILDAAISLLEKNKDIEKANRLLWRYTLEDFKTAKEWRAWYTKYKNKMFFTQSGGFVWMINDPNANPDIRPRNDKKEEVEIADELTKLGLQLAEPTHENPVSVGAMLVDGKNENEKTVLIETNIMSGYHIYAYVPSGEAYIKTELGLDLPEGVDLVGKWDKSSPAPYPGKDKILIYKGESSFKQAIKFDGKIAKGTKVKCWLYYQCCDASICFPPQKKEFVLELN